MPAGGSLLSSGIGAVVGLGQALFGGIQAKKLNAQLQANVRPQYQIPQSETDLQNLALSRANQGMSDAALTANQNQINQNQAAALSAIKQGGDTSNVGGITGAADTAAGNLALYDDKARMDNLNNLQSAYQRMSADKTTQWQLNQLDPWKDRQQALTAQLAGAKNMENAGINTLTSGAMNIGNSLLKANNNSFGTGQIGSAPSFSAAPYTPAQPLTVPPPSVPSIAPGGGYGLGDSSYAPIQENTGWGGTGVLGV